MSTNFTTVRSQRGASQLRRPVTPNGVSASSTWLTPTVTNSVSLGLCGPQSNSAKKDAEVLFVDQTTDTFVSRYYKWASLLPTFAFRSSDKVGRGVAWKRSETLSAPS